MIPKISLQPALSVAIHRSPTGTRSPARGRACGRPRASDGVDHLRTDSAGDAPAYCASGSSRMGVPAVRSRFSSGPSVEWTARSPQDLAATFRVAGRYLRRRPADSGPASQSTTERRTDAEEAAVARGHSSRPPPVTRSPSHRQSRRREERSSGGDHAAGPRRPGTSAESLALRSQSWGSICWRLHDHETGRRTRPYGEPASSAGATVRNTDMAAIQVHFVIATYPFRYGAPARRSDAPPDSTELVSVNLGGSSVQT